VPPTFNCLAQITQGTTPLPAGATLNCRRTAALGHEAIRAFHDVWLAVADETPEWMPHTIEALIGTPVWNRLMVAARDTLQVLSLRGRFNEQTEEQFRG
jgi:hypothetical protein